jgi:hypothetical protein
VNVKKEIVEPSWQIQAQQPGRRLLKLHEQLFDVGKRESMKYAAGEQR